MFLRKLSISNFVNRKMRAALTVAAVALSVSLVVAVTSGYSSALAAAQKFLTHYLGSTDVLITRQNNPRGGVPEKLMDELRADPLVRRVTGRLEMRNGLVDESSGDPEPGHMASVIGVRRPDDTLVDTMRVEAGKWFSGDEGAWAVIDQGAASMLKLHPGDHFTLPGLDKQLDLTVVGIVHKPQILAEQHASIYVPLRTLQQYTGFTGQVTRIQVELKQGVDAEAFGNKLTSRLAVEAPELKVRTAGESKHSMDKDLQAVQLLSYMGGMVSMLAAMFIVFSALSMGVSERQRTLGMLRAVGAFRSQVAGLVVIEGLILAGAGVAIGVPLGWLWIHLLAWKFKKIFVAGVAMSLGGILMGSVGSLLTALAASLMPAYSASRVSPLEAMSPSSSPPSARLPWLCAAAGLVMICIDPFLFYGPIEKIVGALGAANAPDLARQIKFNTHFALGLPAMLLGFFLLSPTFVWVLERTLGPAVAGLLGIRFAMLRQQLSGGIWRAAGTCTALMVGLATLIVLQVQGNSALGGWKLPDKFPDIFIATYSLGGVKAEDTAKLEAIRGIKQGEIMPIAIASPGLPSGFFGLAQAMIMPNATMFFGVDPDKAFKLMELDFREGNPTDAARMLKLGRHVIITNEFRQLKGLGVGDKLTLKTIHGPEQYTVAGVVWSPGIDVIVSSYDMGAQMDQRTAASIFGSLEDARRDFGVDRYHLFAANLDYYVDKADVLKEVERAVKLVGMRAGDVRQIKYEIETAFRDLLLLCSTVAFAAMALASLGVTNTIMASVRSRRWQFGILRSIGVTRSLLLRLVVAEAMLLGVIGCGLGLASGSIMSLDARRLSLLVTGYDPPLAIPWRMVFIGLGSVLLTSVAASIWPAVSVARSDPLTLLQAGRSSS